MQKGFLLFVLFFMSSAQYAQVNLVPDTGDAQTTIKGKVIDAESGELLENVSIDIFHSSDRFRVARSFQTDKQGNFILQLDKGEFLLIAKLEGYSSDSIVFQTHRTKTSNVVFRLENQSASMQAVQITAAIAKNRKTPVAYSNLTGKEISERLGSSDLPLLLNQIPGVYATSQGGGAGDARITIRGFSQRNVAVMVDGIPVNDMENGQVYWSNWFGLGGVTALTQVQRGLGSSRIANPAVGGSINYITKGISQQSKLETVVEIGDSKYEQFSLNYSSGKLQNDWGVLLSFTKRQSAGYIDYLYDDMYAYFVKVEKQWKRKSQGSQTLSFVALGAPQSHGQRSYRARVSLYDKNLAEKLGVDTLLPRMAYDKGRKYNQHWGNVHESTINADKSDTIWGKSRIVNERANMFHKPQLYVKHDWVVSPKTIVTTTVYASYGRGGGVGSNSSLKISQIPQNYGQFDFQSAYFLNTSGNDFVSSIDPKYSLTENKSTGILQRAVNNHNWYGLLNTSQQKLHSNWVFTRGIDLRTYRGRHYREGYDLLGGDYFIPIVAEKNPSINDSLPYRTGDIFGYNNDGLVRWAGLFFELEYSKNRTTAFINGSRSNTWLKRIDYFKKDERGNFGQKTPWILRKGITLKTGMNHNVSRRLNFFSNLGYLDRPTRFSNVFDNRNKQIKDIRNEKVYALEGGSGYNTKRLALTVNAYYTLWKNKPVDFLSTFRDVDGNDYSFNINGLGARHMGLELQAAFKPIDGIALESSFSVGDWIWNSGSEVIVRNDLGDSIAKVNFDAIGVHVGDAAQKQMAFLIRWEPTCLKGAYFSMQYINFGKHYADFDPTSLTGLYKRQESFILPNYGYVNVSGGYKTRLKNNLTLQFYGMVTNITNNLYITDAQHRKLDDNPSHTFNPKNLEVFVSQGLRFTTGIKIGY